VFRRLDGSSLEVVPTTLDDAVGDLENHFLEQQAKVTSRAEI
jgi:hypothetical protein